MAGDRTTLHTFTVDEERALVVVDPVCGRSIEFDWVAAQEEHEGWGYFFCSQRCHQQFRVNRTRFLGSKLLEGLGA